MAVHWVVSVLFFVGWALYLLAEASRMGGIAAPSCDNDTDDETDDLQAYCNGYGAGTAFCMFAFVCACGAAALAKRGSLAWYAFVLSFTWYALAKVSETGGESQFYCNKNNFVHNSNECNGYSAAAVFYFFAFMAAISIMIFMWKWVEQKHYALSAFFVFLSLYGIGILCEFGGQSSYNCAHDTGDDDGVTDDETNANKVECSGYGFAAFIGACMMIHGAVFTFLTATKQNAGSYMWIGFTGWWALYLLAFTSYFGTTANVNCAIIKSDDDSIQDLCNGYGAATFFTVIALIAAMVCGFFTYRGHEAFKQLSFLAAWSLFYLGYTCFLGGNSAADCNGDVDDNGPEADFNSDGCSGYGAGTFFCICGFAVLAAAAVITQTSHGAPQPDDAAPTTGEKDVPSAPPVVTAVPVGPVNPEDDKVPEGGADI